VTGPHITTVDAFIREISKLDFRFTPEQRAALVERSKAEIARIAPILAARRERWPHVNSDGLPDYFGRY
jgi:hypothetical protein